MFIQMTTITLVVAMNLMPFLLGLGAVSGVYYYRSRGRK